MNTYNLPTDAKDSFFDAFHLPADKYHSLIHTIYQLIDTGNAWYTPFTVPLSANTYHIPADRYHFPTTYDPGLSIWDETMITWPHRPSLHGELQRSQEEMPWSRAGNEIRLWVMSFPRPASPFRVRGNALARDKMEGMTSLKSVLRGEFRQVKAPRGPLRGLLSPFLLLQCVSSRGRRTTSAFGRRGKGIHTGDRTGLIMPMGWRSFHRGRAAGRGKGNDQLMGAWWTEKIFEKNQLIWGRCKRDYHARTRSHI